MNKSSKEGFFLAPYRKTMAMENLIMACGTFMKLIELMVDFIGNASRGKDQWLKF